MSSTTTFYCTPEVTLGAGDGVSITGRVYPAADIHPNGLAQVSIDTGAASLTFYPTPEALEALAADLQELAMVVRGPRDEVAA